MSSPNGAPGDRGRRTPPEGAAGSTRDRIVEAARLELADARPLTVNGVAARAGVSRQTIHNHFGGLAGLRATLVTMGARVPPPIPDTRDRILDAAIRVLSRAGAPAGVEDIAAEAGLTKGAIYHHFADRTALLRAVADRVTPIDEMLDALDATADLSDEEALATLLRTYHRAIGERADLMRSFVVAGTRDPELVAILTRQMIVPAAPLLVGWYRGRAERGGFRDVNPTLVFQAFFGPAWVQVVFGPFLQEILATVGGHPVAEVAEQYADLILRGLLPRDPAPGSGGPQGGSRGAGPPADGVRRRPQERRREA